MSRYHFGVNNQLNGYNCRLCNGYNDVLNSLCIYCQAYSEISSEIRLKIRLKRSGAVIEASILQGEIKMSEPQKELHAGFFMKWAEETKVIISQLDDEGLTAWRNEMAQIALKGKVCTATADEELRSRKAKKAAEGKPWLVGGSSKNIGDVTTRAKRLSKEEKLKALLDDLGVRGSNSIIKNASDAKLNTFKIVKTDKPIDVVKPEKSEINFDDLGFLK